MSKEPRGTAGAICAFIGSILYIMLLIPLAWGNSNMTFFHLILTPIATITILTLLFRPSQKWLFSLVFSSPTFLLGFVELSANELTSKTILWVASGPALFLVGLGCDYLTRIFFLRKRGSMIALISKCHSSCRFLCKEILTVY